MWMQDGCIVYMDSYTASNGSCSMVTSDYFQKPPLGAQNQETMALWTLTTIGLFYFIMCGGPAWIDIHWNSIWLMAMSHMTLHYTWGSLTTLHVHDCGGVLGRASDTFFRALTISWSRLLARVKWPWDSCSMRIHILSALLVLLTWSIACCNCFNKTAFNITKEVFGDISIVSCKVWLIVSQLSGWRFQVGSPSKNALHCNAWQDSLNYLESTVGLSIVDIYDSNFQF